MSATLTRDDIFKAPKIDLHRHLDGAVRPELVLRLAKELGVILPTYDLAEFTKLYQIIEPNEMPIANFSNGSPGRLRSCARHKGYMKRLTTRYLIWRAKIFCMPNFASRPDTTAAIRRLGINRRPMNSGCSQ